MEELEGKNIVVTGGTGFIGTHVVMSLLQMGAYVIVPYIEILPKSLFATVHLSNQVSLELIDIRNEEKVFSLGEKYSIDYIVHLAAQTLVTQGYSNPLETFSINIMGTVNILELARKIKGLKAVIVASSDKAYGKTTEAYKEDFPLKGDHPYDVSKSSADLIANAYYKTYNLPVIITRFGNVYGEGDLHLERIIPGICEAIVREQKLILRSDGTYVRDYLYVKDVVDGYMLLLKESKKTIGNAYNFSSEHPLSVIELIAEAEKILGIDIPYVIKNTANNEIPYQHLDDAKVKKLGWTQQYSLEKSLEKTLLWYKEFLR